MTNIHHGVLLTRSIIEALAADPDGLLVGDGEKPDTTDKGGYVVVYSLPGGTLDGPLDDPDDDASVPYQFTSVGRTRSECEWVADTARLRILTATLAIGPTRKVINVRQDFVGGAIRDDDVKPSVWYSPDRYRFMTTPT